MVRNLRLLFIVFFTFPLILVAQDQNMELNDFSYLKSSGDIPEVFTSYFSQKYNEDKTVITSEDSRRTRKTKLRFLAQSNFIIDQILLSGRILFNDPVSEYINKVADNLLKDDPDLRSKLSFYVAKSPSVNAFSTDKGIIIVNLGLIAQLENEAQLAYVLSHEIAHFEKKHNMNLFLEKDRIFMGKGDYNGLTMSEKYLATNYRSREIETEADEIALNNFYVHGPYSLTAVDGVFDVLQYSYLPFDDILFEKSFFETSFMKLPDRYFLSETAPVKGGEDYKEDMSTHPSIKSRREKMNGFISELKNDSRKDFILPKDEFIRIRNLARFESIRQYVILADYPNAIYNSYILLKDFPENKFLERSIAYSLYGLAAYKMAGEFSEVVKGYKKIEGQSQQLYYLLGKLKNVELVSLALRNCWQYKTKYPGDQSFSNICDSLIKYIVFDLDKGIKDFSTKTMDEAKAEAQNNLSVTDTVKKTGKYAKIKSQKVAKETEDESFVRFMFVDQLKDNSFRERFEYFAELKNTVTSESEIALARKRQKNEEKLVFKFGHALGIDKIIVMNPFYYVFDERKKDNVKYFDSEGKLQSFNRKLETNMKILELEAEYLNPKDFKMDDVDRFNDMMLINDWVTEKAGSSDKNLYPYETENARVLIEKYGTSSIAYTGILSIRQKKTYIAAAVFMMIVPYTWPICIYYLAKPEYNTFFFNLVFDIEKGDIRMADIRSVKLNDTRDVINSYIYDSFHQVKLKR